MNGKGSIYPFKVRIKEIDKEKIMDEFMRFNTYTFEGDKKILHDLSYQLAPIRNDINISFDHRNNDSVLSLKNKSLKIIKKGNDFIFRF